MANFFDDFDLDVQKIINVDNSDATTQSHPTCISCVCYTFANCPGYQSNVCPPPNTLRCPLTEIACGPNRPTENSCGGVLICLLGI